MLTKLLTEQIIEDSRPKPDYILNEFEWIGGGTEGDVYSDGKHAYKIVGSDNVGEPEDILDNYKDHNFEHVVQVYDAWKGYSEEYDKEYTVIKMELLDEIPEHKIKDKEVFRWLREALWNSQDNQKEIIKLVKHLKDPELLKIIKSVISAYDDLGYLDVGFHNLMYDSKTDTYKQIDIG